jgi:16S rRNA (cytosine1402-N4)-methyltransferase
MALSETENIHTSVLLEETIDLIDPKPTDVIVDATLGLGGHSLAMFERQPGIRLIGIDQDAEAIEKARRRLKPYGDLLTIIHTNFANIRKAVTETGVKQVNGILADLGVSSLQFDSETRGFSFRFEASLDMRMDAEDDIPTAAELLASLSEEEIANVIYRFGEERFSRRIARRIVERRDAGTPVSTTKELVELVERSVPRSPKDKIHPATRTFQALRIAVNDELGILENFLADSVELLAPGGRFAVISFHSLEDRIVKRAFQRLSGRCQCPPRMPACQCGAAKKVDILTKKPIVPTEAESRNNPRSRSAKLRAVKKLTA